MAGLITESAIVCRYKICQTNPAMEGCPASLVISSSYSSEELKRYNDRTCCFDRPLLKNCKRSICDCETVQHW